MQHQKLTAEKRELLGKKVKQLRQTGKLPANVYGKNIPSQSIQVEYAAFSPIYKEAGETGIIDLTVDGQTVPVLIKNPQFNFRKAEPLHVDFYQVNLKEKITTFVPVKLVGEPLPVAEKQGLLLQSLNEIEIEALPEQLPDSIEADTSVLEEVGAMLKVSDLKAPEGVTILTDPEQNVAQITELVVEEKEPEPVATAAEDEEGAPAAEGETTEAPAEGAPTEEEKK